MPLTNWQEMFNSVKGIFNKLPTLVNGKIPVGIDSLNVTLSSNSLSSSTVTTVNASVSDTTLLASDANRKGFIIFNNSTAILYVLLASGTSSSSNFSILLNQNESLIIDNTCLYTGVVKGIWASATGNCKVTEFS